MPFVSRKDIDPALKEKHDGRYKAILRQALLHPLVTEGQRNHIKAQLASIGGEKVYSVDSPPKPGAISFAGGM